MKKSNKKDSQEYYEYSSYTGETWEEARARILAKRKRSFQQVRSKKSLLLQDRVI